MAKRVFWKVGDHEIEVEGDNAFIQKQLKMFFERLGSTPQSATKDLPSKIVAVAKSGKTLSPAEYFRQKTPNGGTETLIVLGKYLDEFRNKSEFTPKDIKTIAQEAKIPTSRGNIMSMRSSRASSAALDVESTASQFVVKTRSQRCPLLRRHRVAHHTHLVGFLALLA